MKCNVFLCTFSIKVWVRKGVKIGSYVRLGNNVLFIYITQRGKVYLRMFLYLAEHT